MRFVNAKKPKNYAEDLYNTKLRIAALKLELRQAQEHEEFIEQFLRRLYSGDSFEYVSPTGYYKAVKFNEFKRKIMNQKKARLLLGDKVPLSTVLVRNVSVDFVYEGQD